jgi:hypothetical protein
MGLDMYLSKKTYVKNWDHSNDDEKFTISIQKGGKEFKDIDVSRIIYIEESVMYWRKANHIHYWFVKNSEMSYVTGEILLELLDVCKTVRDLIGKSQKVSKVGNNWNGENVIIETYDCEDEVMGLLPTSEGFFFGSYEIDDYYLRKVVETIEGIEGLMNEEGEIEGEFTYSASW